MHNRSTIVWSVIGATLSISGCIASQVDDADVEFTSSAELPFIEEWEELPCDGDCDPTPNPNPTSCIDVCSSSSPCGAQCNITINSVTTCGNWGVCQMSCAQTCSGYSRCDTPCYENGLVKTCGQQGTCNPAPDCLVEFWTGYNYTGTRGCYGTIADVEKALTSGSGRLDVAQVLHNDQYSSFRTIEQVCLDRGISPCRLAGIPNKIKTSITMVYKDGNFSGKSKAFAGWVKGDNDFDNDHWFDSWLQGDIDEKISSFRMEFSVNPTCYRAVGFAPNGCNPLCLDGGAYLEPFDCSVPAPAANSQGWYKVDNAKNVWVRFDSGSNAPTKFWPSSGTIRWGLEQPYYLVYPGQYSPYDIEWRYNSTNQSPVLFQTSVPGAF